MKNKFLFVSKDWKYISDILPTNKTQTAFMKNII